MKVPFVRNPFNYDTLAASNESAIFCDDPSLAVQSERDESDINTIVKRFGLTGQLPSDLRAPTYGDFSDVPTYHDALNAIHAADAAFLSMPADVRSRFENDAGRFVAFCSDASNHDEMLKLGLLVPDATPRFTTASPEASPPPSGGLAT